MDPAGLAGKQFFESVGLGPATRGSTGETGYTEYTFEGTHRKFYLRDRINSLTDNKTVIELPNGVEGVVKTAVAAILPILNAANITVFSADPSQAETGRFAPKSHRGDICIYFYGWETVQRSDVERRIWNVLIIRGLSIGVSKFKERVDVPEEKQPALKERVAAQVSAAQETAAQVAAGASSAATTAAQKVSESAATAVKSAADAATTAASAASQAATSATQAATTAAAAVKDRFNTMSFPWQGK